MFLRHLVRWPSADQQVKFYGDRPRGTPPLGDFYIIRHEIKLPNSVKCVIIAVIIAITPFKVIQGHRVWYQSKAHMRVPISD